MQKILKKGNAMKNLTILLAVIIVSSAPVQAEEESDWTYGFSSMYLGQYVLPSGTVITPNPVLKTSGTALHASGVYANLTHFGPANHSLSRLFDKDDQGSELRFPTLGVIKTFNGIDFDASVSYRDYGTVGDYKDQDTLLLQLRASKTCWHSEKSSLTAFATLRKYAVMNERRLGGIMAHLGVVHTLEINETLSTSTSVQVIQDDGVYYNNPATIGNIASRLNWKVGKNFFLRAPYFQHIFPFGNPGDRRKPEDIVGFGFLGRF